MIARSMLLAAVLAISCMTSANAGDPRQEGASGGAQYKGLQLNGYKWNGIRWNGFRWNGFRFNGSSVAGAMHAGEGSVAGFGGRVVAIEF